MKAKTMPVWRMTDAEAVLARCMPIVMQTLNDHPQRGRKRNVHAYPDIYEPRLNVAMVCSTRSKAMSKKVRQEEKEYKRSHLASEPEKPTANEHRHLPAVWIDPFLDKRSSADNKLRWGRGIKV